MNNNSAIETIESKIIELRGKKVMLDRDLASLYGVETKRLNEQVKRNKRRFPQSFAFQINKTEMKELVANCDRFKSMKHSPYLPYVFSEHGALMSANVINSSRAVRISIFIVETFVRLRDVISSHNEILSKISEIEGRLDFHDETLIELVEAVKRILPVSGFQAKPRIGFKA